MPVRLPLVGLPRIPGLVAPRVEDAPAPIRPAAVPATTEPVPAERATATSQRTMRAVATAATPPARSRDLRPLEPLTITWGRRRQLNDNHPEILTRWSPERAITASSLSPTGMAHPGAHQGQAINGDGSIFSSHQNRTGRELHQNLVLHNPGSEPVRVRVTALASNTSHEAPYRDLQTPPTSATATRPDPTGRLGNGPGERTADQVLRQHREGPEFLTIPPGGTAVLHSARHPQGTELVTQAQFRTDGPVHAAVLYTPGFLRNDRNGHNAQAAEVLKTSDLVARDPAHDKQPSAPGDGRFIYGRVAGVVEGSDGRMTVANDSAASRFVTDRPGTQEFLMLGKATRNVDGQDTAGTLLSRYPDSAYRNHGNYGADLAVAIPLHNPVDAPVARRVRIFIDTPPEQNFGGVSRSIRNSIRAWNGHTPAYFNLNQRAGTQSTTPLLDVTLAPGQSINAALRMINAANNTPPHTLRVVTDDVIPG
jgi:hypothetical protein